MVGFPADDNYPKGAINSRMTNMQVKTHKTQYRVVGRSTSSCTAENQFGGEFLFSADYDWGTVCLVIGPQLGSISQLSGYAELAKGFVSLIATAKR